MERRSANGVKPTKATVIRWLWSFLHAGFHSCGSKKLGRCAASVLLVLLVGVLSSEAAVALRAPATTLDRLFAQREVVTAERSFPELDEYADAVCFVGPAPSFGGRSPAEMLVGSGVVVEDTKLDKFAGEVFAVDDLDLPNRCFEGAEEAFYFSVHPRAARCRDLQPNAEQRQPYFHHSGLQASIVIDANMFGCPVLADCFDDLANDGQRAFVLNFVQSETSSCAVIEDAEQHALLFAHVSDVGQIQSPGDVLAEQSGCVMALLAAALDDIVSAHLENAFDGGFAHRHTMTDREAPIEGIGEFDVTEFRRVRLHPYQFIADPARFAFAAHAHGVVAGEHVFGFDGVTVAFSSGVFWLKPTAQHGEHHPQQPTHREVVIPPQFF
jgi:hypothetical protein